MKSDGSGIGGRGLLIMAVVFILVIGAIFFAITNGFFSGRDDAETRPAVTDITDARSVKMTVRGPIVGDEEHESYEIIVGTDERTITAFRGYVETSVGSRSFDNNRQAYTELVYALARAGFSEKRNTSDAQADERGVCPDGRLFVFEQLDNGRSVERLWTSSCSSQQGNLNARASTLKDLFDDQIPDRRSVLSGISLR